MPEALKFFLEGLIALCQETLEQFTEEPVDPPTIVSFTATPASVELGNPSLLQWEVNGATFVTLNAVEVPAAGSLEVNPQEDETYVLIASNTGGTVAEDVTVAVTVPAPPPPPPPPTLPVDEGVSFTLAEAMTVRYVSKNDPTKFIDADLTAGPHLCANSTFGSDPHFLNQKKCVDPNASSPPPPPPPGPPAPPPPSGGLFDPNGNVIPAAYAAYADSMGTDAGIANLFGPENTSEDAGLPSWPAMPVTDNWPQPWRPGTINFGTFEPGHNFDDPGPYESNALSAAVLEDDPSKTGVRELGGGNVSDGVIGLKPELHWAQGTAGEQGVNATILKNQGKVIRKPVAQARAGGRDAWDLVGFFVTADGAVLTSPSNTAHNVAYCELPEHLQPTCIDASNASEFLVIGCMNRDTLQGELAFVSCVGLGDNCTLAQPDLYPVIPGDPERQHGWWGETRGAMPGWPNLGNIAYMKFIGSIPLPNMHVPTGVSFTTMKNGESNAVPWGGDPGYMGTGNNITSTADRTPLDGPALNNEVPDNRIDWMPEPVGGGAYNGLAHGGLIVVIGGPEKKICFVDATPLWAFYEKMYLTPGAAGVALFNQTKQVGDGALWPFTFDAAPEQKPVVIKTVTIASTPRCVTAAKWGPRFAYVGTDSGMVHRWSLGDYPRQVGGPTPDPDSIEMVSATAVGMGANGGGNITCIARPQGHADGSRYPDRMNEIIVVDRANRAVRWVRFSGAFGSVVRTLQDQRMQDPIAVCDVGNHSSPYYVMFVADKGGRALHGYRYGRIQLNGWPGTPTLELADGSFEWSGAYVTSGKPFSVSGCNIP